MDKIKARGTSTQAATKIDGLLLAEARLNFECLFKDSLVTGDHAIFSGDVVASHVHVENIPRIYALGPKKIVWLPSLIQASLEINAALM